MNNNKFYSFYYSFKGNKNVPSWVVYTFIIYTFLSMGIYGILDSELGFLLFLTYPLMFYFMKQQLQIDFENNKYRLGTDAFGFMTGTWEELPKIEYVSIFAASYRSGSQGGDDSQFFKKLEINLIYSRNKKLNVWVGDDKAEALKAAKFIGQNLNIRVLDATRREFVWLD